MMLTPELYPFLKRNELESEIVLANGINALVAEDAVEIIQYSIYEHQKDARLH
jgi:GTP cyclohydrolase FolE2